MSSNRNHVKYLTALLLAFSILLVSISATLAWFTNGIQDDLVVTGSSSSSYFGGGDGSATSPYIISDPVHLYNLAWLQYIGYFEDSNYYFELSKNINMSGWVLPPIGTTQHPFDDYFNGNNFIISNLTTANLKADGAITAHPDSAEFAVDAGLLSEYQAETDKEVGNCIGFFGSIDGGSVSNFTLSGCDVICYSDQTTVGIVAGNVGAPLSGIGVDDCTVSIAQAATPLSGTVLSDYTLVGHCAAAYVSSLEVSEVKIADPIVDSEPEGGTGSGDTGFGDTIPMDKLYDQIYKASRANATQVTYTYRYENRLTIDGNNQTSSEINHTGSFKTQNYSNSANKSYFSALFSNFTFLTDGVAGQQTNMYKSLCLAGGVMDTETKVIKSTVTGYKIYSGNNYLNLVLQDGSYVISGGADNGTLWMLGEVDKDITNVSSPNYLYAYAADGTPYYLNVELNGEVKASTTPSSRKWTYSITGSSITFHYVYTISGMNFDYYLQYNSGKWGSYEGNTSLSCSQETKDTLTVDSYEENINYTKGTSTYIPLSMNVDDYSPTDRNTGYIVSGSYYDLSGYKEYDEEEPFGDIRISEINKRYISTQTVIRVVNSKDKKFEILPLDSTQRTEAQNALVSGYASYDDAVGQYMDWLNEDTYLYGLHFMNADISADSTVTIPYAKINGQEISDYKAPADCIDFEVSEEGYISFVAASFFENNDCFFSLHQVIRNGSNISEIREIKAIYTNDNSYLYKFDKGYAIYTSVGWGDVITSESIPEGYTLAFDMSWLWNPGQFENWAGSTKRGENYYGEAYYFEIPVAPGEYALGSVSGVAGGGIGAYLLYLDIAANGNQIAVDKMTVISEYIVERTNYYNYAAGVSVVAADGDNDPLGIIAVAITDGARALTISRTGDNIIMTNDGAFKVNTLASGLTVNGATPILAPSNTEAFITKRRTWIFSDGAKVVITKRGDAEPVVTVVTGSGITDGGTVDGKTSFTRGEDTYSIGWNDDSIFASLAAENRTQVLQYTYDAPNGANNTIEYNAGTDTYTVTVTDNDGQTVAVQNVTFTATKENVESAVVNGTTYTTPTP